MGQELIDQHFGHHVKQEKEFKDDDTYYRLLEDDESSALNAGATSQCEPMSGKISWKYSMLPHYILRLISSESTFKTKVTIKC